MLKAIGNCTKTENKSIIYAGENKHYFRRLGIGDVIKKYTYISMKSCSFFRA